MKKFKNYLSESFLFSSSSSSLSFSLFLGFTFRKACIRYSKLALIITTNIIINTFTSMLLPVNIVLYYTNIMNTYSIITVMIILLIINVVTYLLSLKNYQNLLLSKLFYFILYICTLEIAPYYFIYYVYRKVVH